MLQRKSTEATLPCDVLKQELLSGDENLSIKSMIREYYDYKIVPTHPGKPATCCNNLLCRK